MIPKKLTAADVITGELKQVGGWVIACVEPRFPWPTTVQEIPYRGRTVFMLPQFDDFYPALVVRQGAGLGSFASPLVNKSAVTLNPNHGTKQVEQ